MPDNVDLQAIGDAIVAKWAGVTGIAGAGMTSADTIPVLPYILVLNPTLELVERPFSQEKWDWTWPSLLVVEAPGGMGQAQADLRALVPSCLRAFWTGFRLGLPYVQDAYISRAQPDEASVGEGILPVYRFDVTVEIRQNITRTAD